VVIGHTYNTSAKIELPEDFCLTGGGPTPANTTVLIAELEARTLAEEDIFRLVEVSIKNLTPSPP